MLIYEQCILKYVEENYYKFISSISGIAVTLQISAFVNCLFLVAKN